MRKGEEFRKSRNKEEAKIMVQASIIRGFVERMMDKIKIYADENSMINEIKLR